MGWSRSNIPKRSFFRPLSRRLVRPRSVIPYGAVGISFTDGTAFNISSNARMVLNEFVYDPKGKQNSTLISLSKGTFTFVAGQVAKTT